MVVIERKKGENTDILLKRFTRMSKEENIAFEVGKKKFFLKPSLLKKEKQKERLRRKAQMRKQGTKK